MKRTFPIIIILISLSLLGLVILQSSWLSNLIEVTETQLDNKVQEAGIMVVNDLGRDVYNGQSLKLPRRGGLTFNPDFHFHLLRPPTVAQKYKPQEVEEMLAEAFADAGIKDLRFEFAVTSVTDDYEMMSGKYDVEFWDTINNKRLYFPIIPESGSDLEGITSMEKLVIVVPDYRKQIWTSLKWVILGAGFFMLIIMAAFYVTIRSLINQKKLSEIKSDFINNMTHEFKTPLATISLAVDALQNEKVKGDSEKAKYFSGIIKEENVRMNKHVETILQAALMDRQELKLNLADLHVHDIIKQALENHQLQLQRKNAEVHLLLNAKNDLVHADEIHFTNLISNLIDNAIKYSREELSITISTHSTTAYLIIRVEDNGIGMSKESVKRIFEKFYRAHTGNLHNVKGFGLGMSYAKTVIDAHKGKIKVTSTLGKGSAFTIEMPLA